MAPVSQPGPATNNKSLVFKGHLQPPVDERLAECGNFLADEDMHRCFDFGEKLNQIEEYIGHIEKNKLTHNEGLLRDVKAKCKVHRAWIKREDGVAVTDSVQYNGCPSQRFSSRLISKDTSHIIQQERVAGGAQNQMRDDQAPFRVRRENDEVEFLQNLKRDSRADPDRVDENTNLLRVEARAYDWALKEPAMIPVWMHPTKGIPAKGETTADRLPWYRQPSAKRPPPQELPPHLKEEQDRINHILQQWVHQGALSNQDLELIGNLLRPYEPPNVSLLHDEHDDLDYLTRSGPLNTETNARLLALKALLPAAQTAWIESFRDGGVQIMVSLPGEQNADLPGVFYVTDNMRPKQPPQINQLERDINALLKKRLYTGLDQTESVKLVSLLSNVLYPSLRTMVIDGIDLEFKKQSEGLNETEMIAQKALENQTEIELATWVNGFEYTGVQIRIPLPGQPDERPGTFLYRGPSSANRQYLEKLRAETETEINVLLRQPERSDDDNLKLFYNLYPFQYPALMKMQNRFRRLNDEAKRDGLSLEEWDELPGLELTKDRLYGSWVASFERSGVRLEIPNPRLLEESHPGIVYFRGSLPSRRSTAMEGQQIKGEGQAKAIEQSASQKLLRTEQEINSQLETLKQRVTENADDDVQELTDLDRLVRPFLHSNFVPLRAEVDSTAAFQSIFLREMKEKKDWLAEFGEAYVPWLRNLIRSGKKVIIEKRPRAEIRDSSILYAWPPPSDDVPLTLPANVPCEDQVDGLTTLPANILTREREINGYLQKLVAGPLNAIESSRLRDLLRVVMPPAMIDLDSQVRAVNIKSRSKLLTGSESLEFYYLWERWRAEYLPWIRTLASSGIKIRMSTPGVQTQTGSGVLYLQIQGDDELPTVPQCLPRHIKVIEEEINSQLKSTQQLSVAEFDRLDCLLRSIWSSFRSNLRAALVTAIQKYAGEDVKLSSAGSAALESRLACAYETWIKLLPNYSLKIIESGPGAFCCEMVPLLTSIPQVVDDLEADMAAAKAKAMETLQIAPRGLQEAQDEFLLLAHKVKDLDNVVLLEEERAKVETLLEPISLAVLKSLERQIATLLTKRQAEGELSEDDEALLKKMCEKCMWQRMGYTRPELRNLVLPQVQLPDPVEQLLGRRLPGSPQNPAPLTRYVPMCSQIKPVEREINRLLKQYKDGSLVGLEGSKLDFLLRPLMPPHLADMSAQIETLLVALYSGDGLEMCEGLMLVEYQQQLKALYQEWKRGMPNLGIRLDTNWASRRVLAAVYLAATKWRDTMNPNSDIGPSFATGNKDRELQAWRDIDDLVRKYVFNILKDEDDNRKLLLQFIPPSLKRLDDELTALKATDASQSLTLDESYTLHVVSLKFIIQYMNWYMTLKPTQVESYKKAGEAAKGGVNFIGKAERRGIQRAAIELALNLLATNQEQHRPLDRFRRVLLPNKYQPPLEQLPLLVPLEPWRRPQEDDPFKFTKIMLAYQRWKDHEYQVGRGYSIARRQGRLQAPGNYNGPFTASTNEELEHTAIQRQNFLLQLHSVLMEAQVKAPRPLLQQVLLRLGEGILLESPQGLQVNDAPHPFYDEESLTKNDLDVLMELAEPSWSEEWKEYPEIVSAAGTGPLEEQIRDRAQLAEFEKDVWEVDLPFPSWQPRSDPNSTTVADPNSEAIFRQIPYDSGQASQDGLELAVLLKDINDRRVTRSGGVPVYAWTNDEAVKYLTTMNDAGRIHIDSASGEHRVSKIPFSGHPENKYVLSIREGFHPGVRLNSQTNQLEVQYDASGAKGPPIIQPKKYDFFQRVAFRLGRDIRYFTEELTQDRSPRWRITEQLVALTDTLRVMAGIATADASNSADALLSKRKNITLQKIAIHLHKVYPGLASEAGFDFGNDLSKMTERQAAAIIQVKIIDESNKNWDSRFPDDEHVWESAFDCPLSETTSAADGKGTERKKVTKFFSMRRWPLQCQSQETQDRISSGGPWEREIVSIKPKETVGEQVKQDEMKGIRRRRKKVRHISGAPPNFPFGETPYQEAYLSWTMEEDLKDVKEFYPKSPSKGIFFKKSKAVEECLDPFALPEVPSDWQPDNISLAEKHFHVTELAKKTAGFPDDLEYYHKPREIAAIKRKEAIEQQMKDNEAAKKAIENQTGKKFKDLTAADIAKAQRLLGIDPTTGKRTGKTKGGKGGSGATDEGSDGPARNTRSKSPLKKTDEKRKATDASDISQTGPKRAKRAKRGV